MSAAPAPSDGAAYQRFLGLWSRLLAAPSAEFAHPPQDGHLLDVGCCTASLAVVLAERPRLGSVPGAGLPLPADGRGSLTATAWAARGLVR